MKLTASLFVFVLMFQSVFGASYFIAQTTTGNGSGSDISDCQSLSWLNSTHTQVAGDTYNLVGTLTTNLYINASGSSGNPITVYFESGANFTAPTWGSTYESQGGGAITINSQNYITIDGGSNGLIQTTANGTTLANQTNSTGVGAISCSYFFVKNLTVGPMYNRTSTSDELAGGVGVQDEPLIPGSYFTGYTVSNCVIHDCASGIDTSYTAGCSNITYVGNTIYRCNWGGGCGDRSTNATLVNVLVAYNNVYDFSNWDDPIGDNYHHNGFYFWADTGAPAGRLNGVTYEANTIGPNFGVNATSGMWVDGYSTNVLMYNNLIICNTNDAPNNGMLQITAFGSVLNNTFIGGGAGYAVSAGITNYTTIVKGNLSEYCLPFVNNYGVGNLIMDSNSVYDASILYSIGSGGTGNFLTFAEIQAMGYETHTITNNPYLNSNGTLQSNSPAIGIGANFSSLFTIDLFGNIRPTTGAWTIGAYQYQVSGGFTLPFHVKKINDWIAYCREENLSYTNNQ
jgi:hypothetical protein